MDVDVKGAVPLKENAWLCFSGVMKGGRFDINERTAARMVNAPKNPNGRGNSDVVRPMITGRSIAARCVTKWIIDFGRMDMGQAAEYKMPFDHLRRYVKPVRDKNRDLHMRTRWWLHGSPRAALRTAIGNLHRYIVTPATAEHRIFVWVPSEVIPDDTCCVIARDDDYCFGVVHSRVHAVWTLAQNLGRGMEFDSPYTPSKSFETFAFPWPPSREPKDDPRVVAIASAAKELIRNREEWLNPAGAASDVLTDRTLINLYEERPRWLDALHRNLDDAVLEAYGWPEDVDDRNLLKRLLTLNWARAGSSGPFGSNL